MTDTENEIEKNQALDEVISVFGQANVALLWDEQ